MRNLRNLVFSFVVIAFASIIAALPASAKPHTFGQPLNAAQCDPSGHRMVLNIVFQVTGDADSGLGGYWAYDSYTKHVQAWDMGGTPNTYCLQVRYSGSFLTVAGTSPGDQASTIPAGITGTMEGGWSGSVIGLFSPGNKRTKGNIGSKDYGCNILNGDADCSTPYSFLGDYFAGYTSYSQDFWQWTYDAGDNGTWVNSIYGNTGDIVSTP